MSNKRFDHTKWHKSEEWGFNGRYQLERFLNEFDIDKNQICLIGSTILHLTGIRNNKDIDYIIDPNIKSEVRSKVQKADEERIRFRKVDRSSLSENKNHRFDIFGLSDQDILYNSEYHEVIDGFKVLRLEIYYSMLHFSRSQNKHKKDYLQIRDNILGNKNWDWSLVFVPPPWEIADNSHEENSFPTPSQVYSAIRNKGAVYTLKRASKLAKELFPSKEDLRLPSNSMFQIRKRKNNIGKLSEKPHLIAVLFPPVRDNFDQIEDIIDNTGDVKSTSNHVIDKGFSDFVHDIYSIGEYATLECKKKYYADSWPPKWHIEKLNYETKKAGKTFRIIQFSLPNPVWEYRKEPVSIEAVRLREKIRRKYNKETTNYAYDNLILVSHNEKHTKKLLELFENIDKRKYSSLS